MTVAELLAKLLAPDSPWLLALAVVVLVAAGAIGRRLFGSITRQGARIGALETLAEKEQTRRRQVEAELLELGIPLPYWPDDPHDPRELAVLRRQLRELQVPPAEDSSDEQLRSRRSHGKSSRFADDREDLDYDYDPRTSLESTLPPVPVPDDARHRR